MDARQYVLRYRDGTSIEFEADAYDIETSDPIRIQFYLKDVLVLEVNCEPTSQDSASNE